MFFLFEMNHFTVTFHLTVVLTVLPKGKTHWGATNDIILEIVDVGVANMGFMNLSLRNLPSSGGP